MNHVGISDYYDSLPHGEKDRLIMKIAVAIDKSSSTVRLKIKTDGWSRIERPLVESIIRERR